MRRSIQASELRSGDVVVTDTGSGTCAVHNAEQFQGRVQVTDITGLVLTYHETDIVVIERRTRR